MEYSMQDYMEEERLANQKIFPEIIYKFLRIARKQHFCEKCGCEIHKGEHIFWYKPRPDYNKRTKRKTYHKWRKRCFNCEPLSYEEIKEIDARGQIIGGYYAY